VTGVAIKPEMAAIAIPGSVRKGRLRSGFDVDVTGRVVIPVVIGVDHRDGLSDGGHRCRQVLNRRGLDLMTRVRNG
jgi:hypothetical protein